MAKSPHPYFRINKVNLWVLVSTVGVEVITVAGVVVFTSVDLSRPLALPCQVTVL